MYTKYIKLKLLKIEGNWSVKDFAYAVKSISLSWLEYWKNKFQRLDWKKKTLLSFFKLVKLYQNHCYMELAQKGKTLQKSFTATFKGELSESLKPKPESSANE